MNSDISTDTSGQDLAEIQGVLMSDLKKQKEREKSNESIRLVVVSIDFLSLVAKAEPCTPLQQEGHLAHRLSGTG